MTTQQDPSTTRAAQSEAKHVAGVASGEAQNVAEEARVQAKGVLDDALAQIDEQSRVQLHNLKDFLGQVGDDLQQMVQRSDREGLAKDATRALSGQAHQLRDHMDGREPSDLLDEVRDFARRRPGTFLLGALAAGVVAGRFARGAKDASSGGDVRAGSDDRTRPPADPGRTAGYGADPLDSPLGAAPAVAGDTSGTSGPVSPGPISPDPVPTGGADTRGYNGEPDEASEPWGGRRTAEVPPSQGGSL